MNTTTSQDGTILAYEIAGSGPPLVYITGACCHRTFAPVRQDVKVFATRFRILSYDRRGRGDSGDRRPWSLEREAEDVEAMIDALGGSAFLYGHSSGAIIALKAARELGARVLGSVLYDASWVADSAEAETYAALRDEVDGLVERGKGGAAIRRFLGGIGMPRVFTTMLPLLPGWRRMRALAPTLRYDMALTASPPQPGVAAGIASPLRVLVGEKSPASLHAVATSVAGDAGLTPRTVPGQDHMVDARVLLPELLALVPKGAV
ncbi:alpha/beta fold hydrolase [Microbacterium sp. GXS0129]|uniref:alpha/beta fold hydrolase n=1 Tax=Microbacterium sp. GXS0129 TaxID=3377836 RepID=UPI00383B9F4A